MLIPNCCVCPDDECYWCKFAEECEAPCPDIIGVHDQNIESCLQHANSNKARDKGISPLVEFDRKMKKLLKLGYSNKATSAQVLSESISDRPSLLQGLAAQPFKTVRNVQQKIQMNNVYIDDYSLFETLGHITDAEELRRFEGAFQAAEQATKNARPEDVEAAAVKGARAYQAQVTETVNIQDNALVEVVGYIGITRV